MRCPEAGRFRRAVASAAAEAVPITSARDRNPQGRGRVRVRPAPALPLSSAQAWGGRSCVPASCRGSRTGARDGGLGEPEGFWASSPLSLSHPSSYVVLDSHLSVPPVQPEPLPRSLLELAAAVPSPPRIPVYSLSSRRGFLPVGLCTLPSPWSTKPLPGLPPPHSRGLGSSPPLDFFL